jgi:hypothetical protein
MSGSTIGSSGLSYATAAGYAVAANACVYAGIAFLTGRLLPSWEFYAVMPTGLGRLIVALATFFLVANLCFGRLYTTVSPVTAGIISVSVNVMVMVVATLMMEGRAPNFGLIAGASLALLGAVTVVSSR